jgi:nucleoside-triphosphatase THEP1
MALVDEKDLIDPALLDKARQQVIETLSAKGIPVVQMPEKPDLMVLEGEPAAYQKAVLYNYKQQVKTFNEYMGEITKRAIPVAKAMIIDEISSMKYGKYGVKVELAPHAETNRVRQTVEVYELNRALIESKQLPVSRNLLIDATDVPNKEAIKADIPQMPVAQGAA